jgi:sigma-B regulation protein RsbU (phosphoserine phosphatase)
MLPDTRFVDKRCEINPGSVLYIFSDGIYEIHQADGSLWGLDAFIELLINSRQEIDQLGLDYVLNYVKLLSPKESLDDDLSLLKITFAH